MADANPFDSPEARRRSLVFGLKDGRPERLDGPGGGPDLTASAIAGAFQAFVLDPQFSCIAARSAVNHEAIRLGCYDRLADPGSAPVLAYDLYRFSRELGELTAEGDFATFVAAFRSPTGLDERDFERLLWAQLQLLHDRDAPIHDWAPGVSDDPDDPHFSFSFAGTAFFIVGLHPNSSRMARRFPWPTLVFNPHGQFERLRQSGRFEKLRDVVRHRDEQLQGDINPVLADHGADTEARQYSGRNVGAEWHAPFLPHPGDLSPADDPALRCPSSRRRDDPEPPR
ncbi:guanitoxin biosynthesis heme-dependent pre-guanitoxin N-hydroxylase GntA [Tautonia plasticadhaerens]|uniref:YqcI/YcgG family protein n=1 Tax=Tautonia plasticadhaerens TaxID=2527974 RepID=A0A518H214_9BACT|nr:guanitoxin biosynthesis heme-dependent pre-guanitoxin N-hydroxylase GntA [Tautonia plasticadhaerens]QDV34860.1 YqcI/YcgG family protein [Tautonia plasticadhaerens]